MPPDVELKKKLKKASLRYVEDTSPGIWRQKNGKSFKYFNSRGKTIKRQKTLERIESLAIPPAWRDVWICPSPTGYLQATGMDSKKRKQYIYHPHWVKISQENKFNKMVFFGKILPKIRRRIRKDIALTALDREKIIATVIWLLEHTLIRIGNSEYAQENNSYGLTTLRNRHVDVKGATITFQFRGKSGVWQTASITDPRIAKIIKKCIELPGYELFQYLDDDGNPKSIDSADVNEYLKMLTGEDVTAKDFRTWGGTVLCAHCLHQIGPAPDETSSKKNIAQAVKKVSEHLRNTKAVCRAYYIHPVVIESYQKNELVPHFERVYSRYGNKRRKMGKEEFATLLLLKKYS